MPLSSECLSSIDLCVECLLRYQNFAYAQQLENSLLGIVTTDIRLEKHRFNSTQVFVRLRKKFCCKSFFFQSSKEKLIIRNSLVVLPWRGNGIMWIKDLKMSTSQTFFGAVMSQQSVVKMIICFLKCPSLVDFPKCRVLAICFRSKESMMRSIHQTLQFKTQNQQLSKQL